MRSSQWVGFWLIAVLTGLWTTSLFAQARLTLKGHTDAVFSLAFSPNGKLLASAGEDNMIKLWDTKTGRVMQTLNGRKEGTWTVAWLSDGKTLASASFNQTTQFWNAKTGQLKRTLNGYTDYAVRSTVYSAAFSPNVETLAVVVESRSGSQIQLWDTKTWKQKLTFGAAGDGIFGPSSLAFSSDGKLLATGGPIKTIKIWNTKTGKLTKTLTISSIYMLSVAFSPDGKTLCASGQLDAVNGVVTLLDVETGEARHTFKGHSGVCPSVAFSPDGRTLASASFDKTIRLWDTKTGKEKRTLKGHNEKVWRVVYSPDGTTLASYGFDQTIKLWDLGEKK